MLYQSRDRITTLSGYEPSSLPAHTSPYIDQLINLARTLLRAFPIDHPAPLNQPFHHTAPSCTHNGIPNIIHHRHNQQCVIQGNSAQQWKLYTMELLHEVSIERRRRLATGKPRSAICQCRQCQCRQCRCSHPGCQDKVHPVSRPTTPSIRG